jgi:arylsulfatase A-like enzyme
MPNVVVIVADSLRADHLPFYGYEKNTAPFLDSLAEESCVFDNAYAASSWTAPATASIFTSLYPFQHGVHMGVNAARKNFPSEVRTVEINRIPEEVETIAELFRRGGYSTWAVTDNMNICEVEGFHQGFDCLRNFNYCGADRVNNELYAMFDAMEKKRPYFLYLHYMDPHRPLHEREPWFRKAGNWRSTEIARYDSEISFLDQKIKEAFQRFSWDQDTLLVFTSDHGEELWDHGAYGHGTTLYNEVIRIPLFFHFPAEERRFERIRSNVSGLDILPTLHEYLGLHGRAEYSGVSLLPYIRGDGRRTKDRYIFSHLKKMRGKMEPLSANAVIFGNYKYYATNKRGGREFYFIEKDPLEKRNLFSRERSAAKKMETMYQTFLENSPKYDARYFLLTIDEETEHKMKELGYVK